MLHDKDTVRDELEDDVYASADLSIGMPKYRFPGKEPGAMLHAPGRGHACCGFPYSMRPPWNMRQGVMDCPYIQAILKAWTCRPDPRPGLRRTARMRV